MIRREPSGKRERQAREALDDVRRRGRQAAEEETLRVRSELVRLYGWEGYQLVISQMEADLSRLREG